MNNNTILELNNVQIKQQDNVILDNISLKINKGEFIYFVGKTGSGKSSLLKSLYGDINIESGEIYFKEKPLSKMKRKNILNLRRQIGIIFQDFELLMDRSIEDNLKFVMKATGWKGKKKINNASKELLEKVEIFDKAKSYPHLISGGEQQRTAIARALINDPEIIIADEPTGNLDPETSEKIMTLLKTITNENKTLIMATHDYEIINKFPGRIIKFENNGIAE
jgi:cell division transport system ATP-binding protein